MGKYSHLKDHLPQFNEPDQSWRQLVETVKDTVKLDGRVMRLWSKAELALKYREWRQDKAKLEATIKNCNAYLAAATQLLVDQLEEDNLTSFRLADGSTVSLLDNTVAVVNDRAAFERWVVDQDLTDLFSVNPQTMHALVNTRLLAGQEPPDGLSVYFIQKISLRSPHQLPGEPHGTTEEE